MCEGNATLIPEGEKDVFDMFLPIIQEFGIGKLLHSLKCGYTIHEVNGRPGDVVLVHEKLPVGSYISETLVVDGKHKGKKIGTALILAAIPYRSLPTKRQFNRGGQILLEMAWEIGRKNIPNPWP